MKTKRNTFLRLAALAVCLSLLLGGAALAADTGTVDPLVTLAYLTGEFSDGLTARMERVADRAADQAKAEMESQIAAFSAAMAASSAGQTLSNGYETVTLAPGTQASYAAGAEILFMEGSASASSALSDTTAGAALGPGSALTGCHLYAALSAGQITAVTQTTFLMK